MIELEQERQRGIMAGSEDEMKQENPVYLSDLEAGSTGCDVLAQCRVVVA